MNRRYLLIAATFDVALEVRVAALGLERVDPEVPRTIVVVDEDPRSLELLEGLGEVLRGADIGITLDEVGLWAGAYGSEGVMWAAFPHVIAAVGEPGEHVVWLAGNIEVVGSPAPLWEAVEQSEVVAGLAAPSLKPHAHERPDNANGTPYALQPVSSVARHDGELVSRSMIGWQVGSAGLASVLETWPVPRDHPTHEAISCGLVAQQWFNALSLSDPAHVVSARGVVLSIAQLLAREVLEGPGPLEPTVDGEPLSLISLRGLDPEQPHLLEGRVLTARVSDRPALAPVLRARAKALLNAGWRREEDGGAPGSRWTTLPEGMPMTPLVRDLIRAGIRAGAITRSPFTPEGFEQFRSHVTQPARQGGSIGVNRILGAVHASRPDLHAAYPALDGPDGLGFLGWAWIYGKDELSLPESFLPPRPAFLDAAPAAPEGRTQPDTPGVNLAGYFTSELGLGESARQIAAALDIAGVATTPVQGLLVPPTRQQAEFQPVGPQDAHHDVNIVVVNGDQMPGFAGDVGAGFFEDRTTIAVWWWEVDPFPAQEWAGAMEWVDEVWVGTEFIRGLIEPHVDVPVWVFPVPVAVSKLDTPLDRSHFGFGDDETVFLFVWDYHSTESRKNPSGLVEAYRRAFPDPATSKTRLVLKCINHENLPEADEKVRLAAAGRDDITFVDRFLSGREKNGLLELCDCYVSPHRSEGFGYTPAEAMLLGKPVVVTGYGGTTEYTDDTVARMVKWTPSKVGRGALPYPPDGVWADPDPDDLAAALRWIVEAPDEVAAMAERGKVRVETNHGIQRSGDAMRGRLDVVRARRDAATERARPSDPAPAAQSQSEAAVSVKRQVKSALGQVPGARRARARWWNLQDRAVESRTVDLREKIDHMGAAVDARVAAQMTEAIQASERTQNAAIDRLLDEVAAERDRQNVRLEQLVAALSEQVGRLDDRVTDRDATVAAVDTGLAEHIARHAAEPYGIREAGFDVRQVEGLGRALGGTDLKVSGDRYADFLATFRGPYDRVHDLMRGYGTFLEGQGPLLDVGCGRGELLEVAEDAGIDATGVDLDAELVRQAVDRGRSAVVGDGIDLLAKAAEGSLGSVAAIHVVEHLSVEDLEAFFTESCRALREDGLLLVETINPHEVSAASTFWVDPTHRGPIFPEVALALALATGFSSAHVYSPDGTGDWDHDRVHSTRYALIARA